MSVSTPHGALVRAAQSGIVEFPQPNTLGYINNFFHPHAGPIAPGQGFLPLGNLLTSDFEGPYNLSLLSVQENEIKGSPLLWHTCDHRPCRPVQPVPALRAGEQERFALIMHD